MRKNCSTVLFSVRSRRLSTRYIALLLRPADDRTITSTTNTTHVITDLKPNTNYIVQIEYFTTTSESARSDPVHFRTDDERKALSQHTRLIPLLYSVPPVVSNLHVARTTMTGARVAWEPPDLSVCNSWKGYQVYLGERDNTGVDSSKQRVSRQRRA